MNKDIKPIKRSPELAPLSREHHEGLLFVWKIRQGIKHNVHPVRITNFCVWFWQHHLVQHFEKEEVALPPVLSAGHPLIRQMQTQHKSIKQQCERLRENSDYALLVQLAQTVNDHIRFEERRLFSEVEKVASAAQLEEIATFLNEEKEKKPIWEDPFWTL